MLNYPPMCKSLCMSMERISVGVPEFDLADRMRKALRASGVSALEMADYLGVSRNTVSNWINGHVEPSKQSQRLWAMRTGVPYEWLQTGENPRQDGPDGGGEQKLPPLDSNQQPAGNPTRRPAPVAIAA